MPANGTVPTRYYSGVSTQKPTTLFGNYYRPCPMGTYDVFDDFDWYNVTRWPVGLATGSTVISAFNGGAITLTTGAVSGNQQSNHLAQTSFTLTPGFQSWFSINITLATSNIPNFLVGLIGGGTDAAPTDGLYFTKATASQTVNFNIAKASSVTTLTNTTTIADATALSLGFYYDGKPTPTLYAFSSSAFPSTYYNAAYGQPQIYGGFMYGAMGGDQTVASPLQALTNLPLASTNLRPSFMIQTNAASAVTMVVDYAFASEEIARF